MQQWIGLKTILLDYSGLDPATLRVLASVPLHVACALVLRRPLSGARPWLVLLAVAAVNEAVTAFVDRLIEEWEVRAAVRDLALFMALPTFLLLASRIRPLFPVARGRTIVQFAPPPLPQRDRIVDAEFEELR